MKKNIKVFETFAGIGAQTKALKNIKKKIFKDLKVENVGISEWYIDAIITYAKIHHLEEYKKEYKKLNILIKNNNIKSLKEYVINEYLKDKYESYVFSTNSKTPTKIKNIKEEKLKELYIANKVSKNYGSIMDIKGIDLPENIDIFTYSFPCQSISLQGKQGGLAKNSETTSSLVWQILRVLGEMKEVNKLPKVLLMENVKALFGTKFIDTWEEIKEILLNYGYETIDTIINANEIGAIQRRERAFAISIKKEIISDKNIILKELFNFDVNIDNNKILKDILIKYEKTELNEKITNTIEKQLISKEKVILNNLKKHIPKDKNFTLKKSGIKSLVLENYTTFQSENILYSIEGKSPTITASGANSRIKIIDDKDNLRALTTLELWLLMGFEKKRLSKSKYKDKK